MDETIHALQQKVNDALLGADWDTLNELVSPRARIIGPKGFMIGRDEWIGVHQESGYRQVKLDTTDTEVHTYDSAGIRVDVVESECTYHGETIAGRFRVSQTWVTDSSQWRLASVQYTSIAP